MDTFLTLANPGFLISVLLYQSQHMLCASSNVTTAAPLSLQPTQYWDGVDGLWSSFGVLVGTPPQNVRVLPSTSGNTLWVILPEGCTADDPSDCSSLRGFTFSINSSSTWTDQGIYQVPLHTEGLLGYSGNANTGYDTVTFGWQDDALPTLDHQVVAGIATKDFYIGTLGVKTDPVNFDSFNNPQPSLLQALRTQGKIPSSSWSYTAGSYNQQPKALGSLTLGGYDASRFIPTNVSFPFGADTSRDLLVGIQSITSDNSNSSLLPQGVYAFIDSLVPHIWLPLEACQAFEQAFDLVWDDASELYTVNDSVRNRFIELNTNITFKLGPSSAGGSTVDITLPYRSFDLVASPPFSKSSNTTRYFPLRRAQNDSQHTLGRAFLQNAYVIADYDRSNFSVSQALFPDSSVPKKIVAILPPGDRPADRSSSGLSVGALVGIVIASVLAVVCALALVLVRRRHRRRHAAAAITAAKYEEDSRYQKPELDATDVAVHEMDSMKLGELDTTDAGLGGPARPPELYGHNKHAAVHELPAEDVLLPELDGRRRMSTRVSRHSER